MYFALAFTFVATPFSPRIRILEIALYYFFGHFVKIFVLDHPTHTEAFGHLNADPDTFPSYKCRI